VEERGGETTFFVRWISITGGRGEEGEDAERLRRQQAHSLRGAHEDAEIVKIYYERLAGEEDVTGSDDPSGGWLHLNHLRSHLRQWFSIMLERGFT